MKLLHASPYRIFFPLGLLFGLMGTVVWTLFALQRLGTYPGQLHADWMMGGFVLSFVTGFLLTAIPKFTGSRDATPSEVLVALILLLAVLVPAFAQSAPIAHSLALALLLHLLVFSARRFKVRQYDPPPSFVFVGLGLFAGITGAALLLARAPELVAVGRILYFRGMVLSLVLGVGGKLLPALFGIYNSALVQLTPAGSSRPERSFLAPLRFPLLAALLFAGLVIEGAIHTQTGALLQAAVFTAVALQDWRLYKRPLARGYLPFWLWLSAWSLGLGLWIQAFAPAYAVHAMHLAYVGGFGLMILMVASRVTLAHGGYGLELEHRSKALAAASALVILAALTRATAILIPKVYVSHLAYAAATWILACVVWSWVFLPRILRLKSEDSGSRVKH